MEDSFAFSNAVVNSGETVGADLARPGLRQSASAAFRSLIPAATRLPSTRARGLVVLTAFALLAAPTLVALGREHWSTENGAHGPIILATGMWLFWREWDTLSLRPDPPSWWSMVPLALLLPVYVWSRGFHILALESTALYLIGIVTTWVYWSRDTFRRMWFPLLYLAFLVKPPSSLVAELTQPLKIGLSDAAVWILHALDYPVGRSGVLIQIDQYELLVQQACAGLGSLVSLLAIGILYVHLSRSSGPLRNALLILGIIPIAILANLMRILILILLTYHMGDGVAQSFAHDAAGLFTFTLSMLGLFAFDVLIRRGSGKT